MKGNSIITKPIFGLTPKILKSLGLAESCEYTCGFELDLLNTAISKGIAPIVFDTIRTKANIRIYLQKAFLPVKVDSR